MERKIKDYDVYNERMSLSLVDKAFFIDKIPADVSKIVDYGCADGTLLRFLKMFFPKADLIGYDKDLTVVSKNIENLKFYRDDGIIYTDRWLEAQKLIKKDNGYTVVIASSIIHEVYSYGTATDSNEFWDRIYNSGFDYICIRDMMISMSADRPSDMNDVVKVLRKYHRTKELLDFQSNWGNIENNKNLIHFLLKYKYMEPNWEREVRENYIPLYREDFLSMIPAHYEVLFHDHYTLPYLKEQVINDMNVALKDPTHIKVVLSRS